MEVGTCVVALAPVGSVADMCACCGVETLGGEESEWLVSGVRPLRPAAVRFCENALLLWCRFEEGALPSELVELLLASPSSEFGEM